MVLWTLVSQAGIALLLSGGNGQKMGSLEPEETPQMTLRTCTSSCSKEDLPVTLDANWRWVHDGSGTNCYKGSEWDKKLCPDPTTCAEKCHLEGVNANQYSETYGVSEIDGGLQLDFLKETAYGTNVGSRLYLMQDEDSYKIFKLKNREFSFTVDVSHVPCGMNGAVYFVEMQADGGISKSQGRNEAGAKYGTGYCDAQCPHDIKFIDGYANSKGWNSSADTPVGELGSCCAEMDIWEANSRATAYTPHPCNITGLFMCNGSDQCGDTKAGKRYDGMCDKDGCDFNSFRMGNETFFGRGGTKEAFTVDSKQEMTVVTQFITSDGTDTGDLVDIKRFYLQDGKTIPNSDSKIQGVEGNSINDKFCAATKKAFGDVDDFAKKGGMKAMGEALDRGMVLVMSLWDDWEAHMLWLDSEWPRDADPSKPGVRRGPCLPTSGDPEKVRERYPDAFVRYMDLKIGGIGTTTSGGEDDEENEDGDDDEYGADDRRLLL